MADRSRKLAANVPVPNLARDAVIRFPEAMPVTCPICKVRLGTGKARRSADGIGVVVDAETFTAHQDHMRSVHPTVGVI